MLDCIFIGRPVLGTSYHVEVEHASLDGLSALTYLVFGPFEPDAVDVLVRKNIEDGLHVVVERLDGVVFELLDARAEIG